MLDTNHTTSQSFASEDLGMRGHEHSWYEAWPEVTFLDSGKVSFSNPVRWPPRGFSEETARRAGKGASSRCVCVCVTAFTGFGQPPLVGLAKSSDARRSPTVLSACRTPTGLAQVRVGGKLAYPGLILSVRGEFPDSEKSQIS